MKNLKVLNETALNHNLSNFSSKKICAMVKANAYGHGLAQMVDLLSDKVESFGVVNVDEGIAVRKHTDKPVLICAKTNEFKKCKKFDLDVVVDDENDLRECYRLGLEGLHLKLDCGMNRFGVKSLFNARLLNDFLEEKRIDLKSVCTHFPNTSNRRQTIKSYQNFLQMHAEISQNTPVCFGGSGVISYPFKYDILRVGIGLYGYGYQNLKPVMTVVSFISKVFYAKKGEYIGYGRSFKVRREGFFAVVPVGYGDGLRRNLSGKFQVEINGRFYDSVANICMDAFFVRVDAFVKVGQKVTVMADAEEFAKTLHTISYEVLTGFSNLRAKTEVIFEK